MSFPKRTSILIFILVIFYVVGVIGIALPVYREHFVSLSSMNLWLSFVIVLLARKQHTIRFYLFVFTCFAFGLVVEWIGVHTGWLFGNYRYGSVLGSRLDGIPWVIGANWFVLTLCSSALVSLFKWHKALSGILAALLMVLLDVLLEPVAIKLGYWYWRGGNIPMYNYICWFLCALPLTFSVFYQGLNEQNKVHIGLFSILLVFFGLLNILL